jgi:signal transduction histidine kinase
MEAMGGRVWLEANGFGGSRFMLALPVASADAVKSAAAAIAS